MSKKNNTYFMFIITFLFITSNSMVFAEDVSTEISENTGSSLTTESTIEHIDNSSSTKETIESSQNVINESTQSLPTDDAVTELRTQFEMDSRNEVMSFEEYKTFIETINSLATSQSAVPAARSIKAGTQRDQIVAEAKKHIGKPYTQKHPDRLGPNKFDCSGLTRYVFLQVTGKNIGDWTVPQEKSGTKVSISKSNISQLEPGDLLFWGNSGATYHVAIYIGNGQYIHAPNYDQNVEVSPIWWTEFPPSFALKMNFTDSKPQGNPINDGSYVTITQKGYSIFSSFDWSQKNTSDKLLNNTYQAKLRYNHSNGATYYSLYDSNGNWQGYINSKAVKKGNGKQGVWLKNDDFVTVTSKDAIIWEDINDFSSKKGSSANLYQKTYHAQGRYNHFSGEVYYSLFNDKGIWQGYINKKSVEKGPGKQGIWIRNDEFVTITSKDAIIWEDINDFSSKKGSSANLYQKTYHAQGRYNHFSGEVYYSLFNNKGIWQGYINKKSVEKGPGEQGIWMRNDEFVTITNKDAIIWENINDFSSKKGSSANLYQKTYHAQGRYNHFSGEVYYSLFNDKGIWQGYINKKSVEKGPGEQGIWIRNDEHVTITKKDYTIWADINDFSSKKGTTNSIYKKTYHAQGRYNHFSGEIYYSLYDSNKKWIGYINKTGVSVNK
ncbi:peptidoglycan DL-endopeptidase CwlO [Enterococcus sp. DIV0840]|uniref:C40 family peptidase n=1 Tax=Enterococcus TaxID=1350 RepID=UPI001F5C9749|nr:MULTISPECIES: C40 family peptidase [Enterococcus]